jgi:hypothetical protein
MRKKLFATNEGRTEDQATRDNLVQESETTGEGPETTRDRPESTRQTGLNTTETVQVTTQTSQERLDNNFQELHRLSEDILSDYRCIGEETGPQKFKEDLVREQKKHEDFQTKILDKNADLKKTSAENTIAPVIEKEIIANDNAVIADQYNHMKDLDKILEDKKYNPYEKEMGYGIQIDLETKKHRRNELLAEREEYLRTRNLELQVLIDNVREGVPDPEPESDFDINERSESDLDFESESSDMYGPAPEHRREVSEDSDMYGPAPEIKNEPQNRNEDSESEIKNESPSIKVEPDSDIDHQNISEARREVSEDSDMYGPAPEIPKSNKRKFDQVSQGEVSQQEGSQQEGGNKKEKKENSILDDYADVSTEPADYFGGDD